MPSKTKEVDENLVSDVSSDNSKKSSSKKTSNAISSSKKTSTKKNDGKTVASKSTKSSKVASTKITSKSTTKKSSSTSKKTTSSKKSTSKTSSKATSSKKKTAKKSNDSLVSVLEYYDLPYRYNQTVVKVLAQTPNILFVYWDISDEDRNNFKLHYGDNFFDVTKPVLIVHNETMNYSFELEINDFANSWYLHINDANCKYNIELGRRPIPYTSDIHDNYIYISSSNKMDSPNNHILFEKFNPIITYKNVKNNFTVNRDFSSMASFKNMQKIYGIYDLYKRIYKDELFDEIINGDVSNPSSGSSSSFK